MKVVGDGELVAAVQAGDPAAYGELFERYQSRIYNFCYGILGNAEDARDATQDAFIRVYEAIPRKENLEFSAYLYRTARNLSYDVAKARGRYTTPEALETVEESNMHLDPVRSTLFSEQRADVRDAVASLPEDYRAVLMLREVQELSYQQIADALDMPRNTVGVMIMRARLKFKGAFRMSAVDAEKLASECQAMLPKLSAYIDDELAPAERELLDAHLEECPLCRLALDEMREASQNYRAFIPLFPPPSMLGHVMSHLGPQPAPTVPEAGPAEGAAAGEGAPGGGASGGADGYGGGGEDVAASTAHSIPLAKAVAIIAGVLIVAGGMAAGWVLAGGPPPSTRVSAPGVAATTGQARTAPAAIVVTPTVNATADLAPIVDTKAPPTPRQLSPADGAHVPASATLKWSSVKDPSGVTYEVDVDQWIGGGAGWEHVDSATGLTATHLDTEASGMARRWRVRATDGAGNAGKFSGWREFFLSEPDPGTQRGTPLTPPIKPGPPVVY